jgi:hypothetical protein
VPWKRRRCRCRVSWRLELVDERLAPAAVWETLPQAVRAKVTVMLARLVAAMVEEARDE